jgi:hypothetical protein
LVTRFLPDKVKDSFDSDAPTLATGRFDARRAPSPSRSPRRFARVPRGLVALLLAVAALGGWLAAFDVSPMALNNAALMALMDPTAGRDTAHAPSPAEVAAAPDLSSVGLRLASLGPMKVGLVARAARYVYESADGARVVLFSAPSYRLLMWTHVTRRYVIAGAATAPGMMRAADVMTDAHNDR